MSDTHKTESLHDQIMRLPCTPPKDANVNQMLAYKSGHRDARHAAAELAAAYEADAQQAAPVAVPDGYRMVPAEPTQEMWAASGDAVVRLTNIGIHHDIVSRVVYDAMLAAAPTPPAQQSQASLDVLAERRRQIEAEGWTPEHDDEHQDFQMSMAAACYAIGAPSVLGAAIWPWKISWWKPSPDARRNLVKAGALILAEIERLDRADKKESSNV